MSYVTDSLRSTLGDIDSSHTVKENDVYDAFGNIVYAGSLFSYPNGKSVLYSGAQGYHTDNDTGLIRCGNRYYNPYIGRFISQDPIGDGDNWYAYCDNDPVGASDPDGLEQQSISGGYDPDGDDGSGFGYDGTAPADGLGDDQSYYTGKSRIIPNSPVSYVEHGHAPIPTAGFAFTNTFKTSTIQSARAPGKTKPSNWSDPPVSVVDKN